MLYKKISEMTLIPLSLAIVMFGGVFWLTQIYVQGNANAAAITKHEVWESKMERRLYLIMGALNIKDKGNDE